MARKYECMFSARKLTTNILQEYQQETNNQEMCNAIDLCKGCTENTIEEEQDFNIESEVCTLDEENCDSPVYNEWSTTNNINELGPIDETNEMEDIKEIEETNEMEVIKDIEEINEIQEIKDNNEIEEIVEFNKIEEIDYNDDVCSNVSYTFDNENLEEDRNR